MAGISNRQARLRFGPFELDVRAGELRKHGIRIKLREQPVQILLMLLEHPGEVVLREEIRLRLWPNNTVVEFDHGINAAVQKLRDALGESADSPRYVETVARRGYRFLGEVERIGEPEPAAPSDAPEAAAVVNADDLSGRVLRHYRILHQLGVGGMGVVYRAEDLKLGRQVALKFLTPDDSEPRDSMLRRFEREARAASALNHPHICTIHGLEDLGGQPAIVMELVEGETLAARLAKGPLPPERARELAIQIAGALAEAHRRGVVHRDLKPANLMLTKSGVKVLDFGLAKMQRAVAASASADADTLTRNGAIAGSLHYMSPEQVQGKEVDARSDIFSFGLVLYEMLSGRRAFEGESAASVIAGILEREPPAVEPDGLNRVVKACLTKDPEDRFEAASDLKRAIEWSVSAEVVAPAVPKLGAEPRWRGRAAIAAAALLCAAGAALLGGWWGRRSAPDTGNYRFTPMEVSWAVPINAVWSPDGKAFAYTAEVAGVRQIFLRYLNSATPVQLTHSNVRRTLAGWSPDRKRVLFSDDSPRGKALFSLPVFGGEPNYVMPLDVPYGAFISPDGKALAALGMQDGKAAVKTSSPIGSPLRAYAPMPFEAKTLLSGHSLNFSPDGRRILLICDPPQGRQAWVLPWPAGRTAARQVLRDLPSYGPTPQFSWLPDSRHVIVTLQESHDDQHRHLWIADVDSGTFRRITSGTASEAQPRVSPDGKKVLFDQYRMDYSFVSVSLENAAAERVLSSEVEAGMPAWAMNHERFAYVTSRNGPPEIWTRGEGWDRPIVTPASFPAGTTNLFMTPALSPGADRLVYTRFEGATDGSLWISSVSGGPPVRLTNESGAVEFGGSWSPDGNSFTYFRSGNKGFGIMVVKASGEAAPVLLRSLRRTTVTNLKVPQWSPDGQWIKFLDYGGGEGWTLISLDGKTVRPLGMADTFEMTFSKDSKLLYGMRREGDRLLLFSMDLAGRAVKNIGYLANDYTPNSYAFPGIRLSLSPDGKSILYPTISRKSALWMLEGFDGR